MSLTYFNLVQSVKYSKASVAYITRLQGTKEEYGEEDKIRRASRGVHSCQHLLQISRDTFFIAIPF